MNVSATLFEPHDFVYGGHRLYYETVGEGPPFVLLHGILLDAHINRELATRIAAEGYRVILLDLLGHGRSDKTTDPKDHRADFYADQVIGLLDHLQLERAVVGGVSLGCIVSLHVAAKAPQRVTALFLEMPVMEWSAPWAALMLSPLLVAARFLRFGYAPLARLVKRLPRPRGLKREWLAGLMNTASLDPGVVAAILHGVLVGPIVPSELQRRALHMPALVLGHTGDKLHEFRDAHVLSEQLSGARLLEARHILELRTRPERLWPEIADFLHEVRVSAVAAPAPARPVATAAPQDDLRLRFEQTVEKVRSAPADGPFKPSNELKLRMYALFRQATDGDVQGKRPGMLDLVARFKYDAWATLKGTSRDEAMKRYIEEVDKLERTLV
ncbi:MAG: acyl-CoA-binding protein [Nevskia sp.]|nr:acyl-CoA-binding protein [Nevskia sp.]